MFWFHRGDSRAKQIFAARRMPPACREVASAEKILLS